jgi:Protein kinase domain
MEYMDGGSLAHRVASKSVPRITENEARLIMARLFSALSYLHLRGIVHRNVKPENILLEAPGEPRWPDTVRLSDFRMACYLHADLAPSIDAAEFAYQLVGTPDYMAPEAAVMIMQPDGSRRPTLGTETDMWAAGVTLYNILSQGALPFPGATAPEVLRNARHAPIPFDTCPAFRDVSLSAMSLIRALLNPDRRKRPSAESVLYHPWFDSYNLCAGRSVMRDPPLVGYQKFRVLASCVRFLVRVCAITPGMPKVLLSAVGMRMVANVAPVNLPSVILSTTHGVNIEPNPSMLASRPHGVVKLGGVVNIGSAVHHVGGGDGGGGGATDCDATMDVMDDSSGVGVGDRPSAVEAGCVVRASSGGGGGESPFQFTTSTLAPAEATAQVLRVSQTSSLGSQSFRSSHESSRFAQRETEQATRHAVAQQEKHSRRQLQVEQQAQREASFLQERHEQQERILVERQQVQHEAHLMHQRQQQELMQQQMLQQQQQMQQLEQQQMALQQQQLLQQQQQHARGSGLIGGLLGAIRRDTSPHTSNPGSRAHSNLANLSGSVPIAGVCTGELSAGSTRSHMRTGGAVGIRMDSNPGDESMGSMNSSPSNSNRSMYPLSDSLPGSGSLPMLAAAPANGDPSGGYRADSGVGLTDLAPALSLTGSAIAGMSPGFSVAGTAAGQQPLAANQGNALRYHSAGYPQHTSTMVGAPGIPGGVAGSAIVGSSGKHAPAAVETPPGGKDKRSKKKLFEGLRSANFGAFGLYNNTS